MNARTRTLGLAAVVMTLSASAATVACMAPPDEGVDDGSAAVSTRERFDKDDLIADRDFLNRNGMTPDQIQRFLERTPYGSRSILATYRDPRTNRTAAEIVYEASARYGLNPLLLLVRLQMEQGLVRASSTNDRVYAETQRGGFNPSESSMDTAFGCGCPHSPVCNDDYRGFANQAECAAGTLRRSFERATSPEGTVGGWSRGRAKRTEDGITVTPRNAATAALYTYTPWVGQAGGGRQGIGGASLHWQTWFRFADAVGYRITGSSADCQNYRSTSTTSSSSGGYGGYVDCSLPANQYDPQCTGRGTGTGTGMGSSSGSYRSPDCSDPRFQSDPMCTGRGLTQNCDQWYDDSQRWGYGSSGSSGYGASSSSGGYYGGSSGWGGSSSGYYGGSSGAYGSSSGGYYGGTSTSSSSSGALPPVGYDAGSAMPAAPPPPAANPNNDQQLLGSSSGAPAANTPPPPPRASGSSSSSSSSGGSGRSGDDDEEDANLPEKKADSGGCSTTGTGAAGSSGPGLVGLGLAALAVASRRRRA